MGESTDAKSSKVDKRSLGFDKRKSAYLPDEIASYEAMAEKKEPFKARFPPPVPNTLAPFTWQASEDGMVPSGTPIFDKRASVSPYATVKGCNQEAVSAEFGKSVTCD